MHTSVRRALYHSVDMNQDDMEIEVAEVPLKFLL